MNLFKKENDLAAQNSGDVPPETENKTLGSRISELRKQHGYTQGEFADLLNVTPQAVSKWENDISCPDIALLPTIAGIFKITVDELLTGNKKAEIKQEDIKVKNTDDEKLKLMLSVYKPNQKPVKITLPLSVVKKFARIGVNISGIVGNNVVTDSQIEQILALVDEGVTGTLLDIVTEDETNVVIEIKK